MSSGVEKRSSRHPHKVKIGDSNSPSATKYTPEEIERILRTPRVSWHQLVNEAEGCHPQDTPYWWDQGVRPAPEWYRKMKERR